MDMLFGCWHSNYSFPMTRKRGDGRFKSAQQANTYVVCLDCGKEFAYDWKQMKVTGVEKQPVFEHGFEHAYENSYEHGPVLVEVSSPLANKQAA